MMSEPLHTPRHANAAPDTLSHSQHAEDALRQAQHASLDRGSTLPGDGGIHDKLQRYPIRASHPDHDPLAQGIAALGSQLGSTLLPMLQQPILKGPDNIGAPNCRGVKGMSGTMVQVAPKHNLHITTVPLDFDLSSPTYPPPRPYNSNQPGLQSPAASLQSPVTTLKTPVQDVPPTSDASDPPKSATEKDEFKTEFRFVVNEDSKSARNTVRQHVMREFRRRERWELGKNKVSKAKKPSKKESKKESKKAVTVKTEPVTPTLPQPSSQPVQTPVQSSFQSEPSTRRNSKQHVANIRRHSNSMSVSGQSDNSTDSDKLAATMTKRKPATPSSPSSRTPFASYMDQGLIMRPETAEEAVEEIERTQLQNRPYQQDPWAELARAQINPFSTHLDIGAGAASRALLHHYAWVMPSLMDEIVTGTVFHRIGWLYSSVAVHDPTPYHTIMGFTLGHIAMLRGQDEPHLAIEHKEKSIQLIHRRLANPVTAASDDTVGAIANIAAFELIDINPDRFAMHMQGLARLIAERGGMSSFSQSPSLEGVLVRLDSIRAYMTISQPRFPEWASLRDLTPLAINIGPTWYHEPLGYDLHQYLFCEDAIRLIHGVEDVLMLMRSLSPYIPFTPDPAFRSLLLNSLLYQLRRDLMSTSSSFSNHPCRRAIRLAAIVLVDIASAEFFQSADHVPAIPAQTFTHEDISAPSASTSVTRTMGNQNTDQPERAPGSPTKPKDRKGLGLTRLRERFPSVERNRETWGRSVEMILAVLMQAERVSLERPFRAWYIADIITTTMKLGEDEWQAVENALAGDIMARIAEEQAEKEAFGRGERNGKEQPVWEVEETVRRFWANWN